MSDHSKILVCDRLESFCKIPAKIKEIRQIGKEIFSLKQKLLS